LVVVAGMKTPNDNAEPTKVERPRHTKNVIKMVQVVPLFSTEHSKGKILGSFSRIEIGKQI